KPRGALARRETTRHRREGGPAAPSRGSPLFGGCLSPPPPRSRRGIGVRLFVRSQCASNSHREVTVSDSQIGECYLHRAPSKKLYGASRHGLQPRPIT